MRIGDITHVHLRKIFEDNPDFVREGGDISEEDFEILIYELFYSLLIAPSSQKNGEFFPVILGDDNGKSFLPLFTDMAEYQKAFAGHDGIHPLFNEFDEYMHLGIDAIVINPTCEQFLLSSKTFEKMDSNPIPPVNITDETLDEFELKKLFNEKSDIDLSLVYDYEEFFKSLVDCVLLSSIKIRDNIKAEDGIIRLGTANSFNVTAEGYLELFTDSDEIKRRGGEYGIVVKMDTFIDFLLRMDYSGFIINPESDAVVVERNVLLTNFGDFKRNYNSDRFAKACNYAFTV